MNLTFFIETTAIFMALIIACDIFTKGWQQRKIPFIGLSLLLGIVFMGHNITSLTISSCLGAGILLGILFCIAYIYILRFDKITLPCAIGSYMILTLIQKTIFNAYPGAFVGGILSIITLIGIMVLWIWILQKKGDRYF